MDRKAIKYAISVLNVQLGHCKAYEKKYGRMHNLTLEQQAYTKGLKDAIELITDKYLSIGKDGKYKSIPLER